MSLKEYIQEEEWEAFQPAHGLSPDISEKMWEKINKNKRSASPGRRSLYVARVAVAAVAMLVIGLTGYFLLKAGKTNTVGNAPLAIEKNIFNNTSQKWMLTLSDGSTVELLPKSTLSYPVKFDSARRQVKLNGEACFSIAKDISRPFYVYSHSVLITVLGTRFTVNAYDTNSAAKVVLDEGSVMVQIANASSRRGKKEYYLAPGDILTTRGVKNDTLSARILHLEKDKDDRYVFNNYPLDVVFDQLAIIYNTKIAYDKSELGNRSFIGKIDKNDSLYHILQSISLLNNFSLHHRPDGFIIGSAHPY